MPAAAGTNHATSASMTHKNVEQLLGRLLTDPALRRRFMEAPQRLLTELRAQGVELSAIERDALALTDRDSLVALAERIDQRLRKIDSIEDEPSEARGA